MTSQPANENESGKGQAPDGPQSQNFDSYGYWSIATFIISAGLYSLTFNTGQGGPFNFSGCIPILLSLIGVFAGILLSLYGINYSKKSVPCWIGFGLNFLPLLIALIGLKGH